MGEQIVGTTKTSISLDDSLIMFPTLIFTFSHSVGWLVTSFPNVFIKSDSLPVDGEINWSRACSGSLNRKSLSLFVAKLNLATPRETCLLAQGGILAICGIFAA